MLYLTVKHKFREFSVNKKTVIENLEADSLRTLRLVYNAIITAAKKKELHEIEIGNKMLLSSKSVCSRYNLALEENQKARNDSKNDRKKQIMTEEVEIVKRRHMEVQSYITVLNKDIQDSCKVEEKHKKSYFFDGQWAKKDNPRKRKPC